MTEFMELVTQLTDVLAELEKKVATIEKRVAALEVAPSNFNIRISELKKQTDQVMMRMSSLDEHIYNQNRSVMEKIDVVAAQMKELRKIIYETGLVVVGPEMIDRMEKRLEEKAKPKEEAKPTRFGRKKPAAPKEV